MEDAKNKMAGIMKGTNFFRHIALLIAFVFLTTGLTACIQNHKIYEDGYWQYIVIGKNTFFPQNSDDREVAIVGLTEIGKEQTSLDVPPTIDGMDVTHIGYYKRSWISGGNYRIESSNLERLYLHDNIKKICREALFYFYPNNLLWEDGLFPHFFKILYCGMIPFTLIEWEPKIYVYKELYDESDKVDQSYWGKAYLSISNVAFMNNYSAAVNRGYFRAEDVESGEKIPEPPVPKREGYVFTGWYTETEAINLWDFDTKAEIPDGEELRLYAGWQAKQ